MPAHSTLFKNLHSMTRERASRAYEAMVRATVEEDLPFIAFDCPYARTLRDRDPAVVAPCSRTLIETYVPRVCASIEHAVKKELERARHLMLTVDGWRTSCTSTPSWSAPRPPSSSTCIERTTGRMDPHRPSWRSMKVETLNKQLFGKWNALLVPRYDDLDDEQAPKRLSRPCTATAASTAARLRTLALPPSCNRPRFQTSLTPPTTCAGSSKTSSSSETARASQMMQEREACKAARSHQLLGKVRPPPSASSPTTTAPPAAMDHS